MAQTPKKFLDVNGLAHFAGLLNNYPNNSVLSAVINAIEAELDEKQNKVATSGYDVGASIGIGTDGTLGLIDKGENFCLFIDFLKDIYYREFESLDIEISRNVDSLHPQVVRQHIEESFLGMSLAQDGDDIRLVITQDIGDPNNEFYSQVASNASSSKSLYQWNATNPPLFLLTEKMNIDIDSSVYFLSRYYADNSQIFKDLGTAHSCSSLIEIPLLTILCIMNNLQPTAENQTFVSQMLGVTNDDGKVFADDTSNITFFLMELYTTVTNPSTNESYTPGFYAYSNVAYLIEDKELAIYVPEFKIFYQQSGGTGETYEDSANSVY